MECSYFGHREKGFYKIVFPLHIETSKNSSKRLSTFYKICVRPVMEYACPVFLDSLPIYLSEELEKLKRRAFRIIYPTLSYEEALVETNVVSLFDKRQDLASNFLNNIVNDERHKPYGCRYFSDYNFRRGKFYK